MYFRSKSICIATFFAVMMMAFFVVAAASADESTDKVASLPTAATLDAYLAGKGSPMTGQGAAFLASAGRWQVDPRLIVAIAGAESNFGAITCAPFNAWGYGCPNGPYEFTSWADGIETVAQGLRSNYLSEGRTTVALINMKYAPIGADNDPTGLNNNWTINVSKFLIELGGDPQNIDIDGVAGTRLLGLAQAGFSSYEFDFTEDSSAKETKKSVGSADLSVEAGTLKPLSIYVENVGNKTWNPSYVRLRRVDTDERVVGDPVGALTDTEEVKTGEKGRFIVRLSARGTQAGEANTHWRMEGPTGIFGPDIERKVSFAVPSLVVGESAVETTSMPDGLIRVVVRVRNAGSATWVRDGVGKVQLGVTKGSGASLGATGWVDSSVPSKLLEREVSPGDVGTFAFRVRTLSGELELLPFSTNLWAKGKPILLNKSE